VRTDVDPVKARELEGMRLLARVLIALAAVAVPVASAPSLASETKGVVAFAGVRWSGDSVAASIYTMRAGGTSGPMGTVTARGYLVEVIDKP
jgi:hypothetical protein